VTVLLVALAVGVVAALAAYATSASRTIELDPIDPVVEERAVERAARRSIRRHPKVQRFARQRFDRTSAGGFMLTVGFLVVWAVATVLGLLLALINHNEWMREIDDQVAEWGAEHATSGAVDFIRFVTNFGSTPVVAGVLLLVAIADYVRRRNGEVFLFVAAVGLGELVLNNLIKVLVQRDRPDVLHLMEAGGYSFPSGHTAAAAAGWSAVALVLGRDRARPVRAALAGAAALIAMTVAASRALLGVHWVSDVLGGLALGWGWFLLVAIIFGGRHQRLGEPVEQAVESEVIPIDRGRHTRKRVDA
jgi:undecaprenyl-diphosphatase